MASICRFTDGCCGVLCALLLAVAAPAQEPPATVADHFWSAPRLLGDHVWRGDDGLTLDLYYNGFFGVNTRGGADTSKARQYSHSIDLLARGDTERMGLWPDGLAFLMAKHNRGKNINPAVGALADPIDDADFNDPIYIDQLWYEHSWLDDRLRFRFGYLDQQAIVDRNRFANSEDVQFQSTFLDNNPMVPLKIGFGATVFVEPSESLEVIAGTADAENQILDAGFDTAFDDANDLMAYFEVKQKVRPSTRRGELPGTYRVGLFYDPRSRPVFGSTHRERGELGGYLSLDQMLYRESDSDAQGLGMFARLGYRDADLHRLARFWSAGLQYLAPLPTRNSDAVGLAIYDAIASSRYRARVDAGFVGETGLELYYRLQVAPWLAVTADLQYIADPGGQRTSDDALVFVLRSRVKF